MDHREYNQPYGSKFKESWNKTDDICPHCKNVTKVQRGLTKQNLRRLVFSKPTAQDWMMLAIICLVLLLAWRYQVETKMAHDTLNNIDNICLDYLTQSGITEKVNQEVANSYQDINITLIKSSLI